MFGHFGSYQAVNAMMAEQFGAHGWISFFEPRLFTVQNGEPAFCLLYFPYSAWFSRITQLLLHLSPDWLPFLGRLASCAATWIAAFTLRRIAFKIYDSPVVANVAALLFLCAPMVTITGISFQNEAWALLFILLSMRFLIERKTPNDLISVFVAGFFYGLALTARIHFAFFILPAIWYLGFYKRENIKSIIVYGLGAVLPLLIWGSWFYYLQTQHADTVQTSIFIQSDEGRFLAKSYLGDPAFWIRLAKQMAFFWANPIFWLLLIKQPAAAKGRSFIWVWLAASLTVILILPQKVFDHPFYLMGGIPAFVLLIAPFFQKDGDGKQTLILRLFLAAMTLCSLGIFLQVQRLPAESLRWMAQSRQIQTEVAPNQKIVLQHEQTAAMLFYTHRLGWGLDLSMKNKQSQKFVPVTVKKARAMGYGNLELWLEELRSQGADWLVITDAEAFDAKLKFAAFVRSHYPVKKVGQDLLFFNLKEGKL